VLNNHSRSFFTENTVAAVQTDFGDGGFLRDKTFPGDGECLPPPLARACGRSRWCGSSTAQTGSGNISASGSDRPHTATISPRCITHVRRVTSSMCSVSALCHFGHPLRVRAGVYRGCCCCSYCVVIHHCRVVSNVSCFTACRQHTAPCLQLPTSMLCSFLSVMYVWYVAWILTAISDREAMISSALVCLCV